MKRTCGLIVLTFAVLASASPGSEPAPGDGKGAVVEWAVEMRRFDETQTLDHVAERGELDAALADELGRAVARAHATAPIVDAEAGSASDASDGGRPDAAPCHLRDGGVTVVASGQAGPFAVAARRTLSGVRLSPRRRTGPTKREPPVRSGRPLRAFRGWLPAATSRRIVSRASR